MVQRNFAEMHDGKVLSAADLEAINKTRGNLPPLVRIHSSFQLHADETDSARFVTNHRRTATACRRSTRCAI